MMSRNLGHNCLQYKVKKNLIQPNQKYMFADGEIQLRCKHFRFVGYVYRTSRGPFGIWPQCPVIKQGIV